MSKPPPSLAPGRFAEVSSIAPGGPGRFDAEVHPDGPSAGNPTAATCRPYGVARPKRPVRIRT